MPAFYLHLHDELHVRDEKGTELPDLQAARQWATDEARLLFGQLAKEEGRIVLHHRIDIETEAGQVLDTVWLRDAIKVED